MTEQKRFTFGDPDTYPETVKPMAKQLNEMHRMYGKVQGAGMEQCGDCIHFRRYHQSTTWFKCDLSRQTGGPGTDWRVHWGACGKWERRGV